MNSERCGDAFTVTEMEKKITSLSVTQHLGHIYTQICVTNFIENLKLESKGQSNYPDHHQLELFISS